MHCRARRLPRALPETASSNTRRLCTGSLVAPVRAHPSFPEAARVSTPQGVALLLSQAPAVSPLCPQTPHACVQFLTQTFFCVFLRNFITEFFIQRCNYLSMSLVLGWEVGAGGHEFVLQKTLVNIWRRSLWSRLGVQGQRSGRCRTARTQGSPWTQAHLLQRPATQRLKPGHGGLSC